MAGGVQPDQLAAHAAHGQAGARAEAARVEHPVEMPRFAIGQAQRAALFRDFHAPAPVPARAVAAAGGGTATICLEGASDADWQAASASVRNIGSDLRMVLSGKLIAAPS